MCYVSKEDDGTYKFDRWVDGYEWQTLPSKTVAFISGTGTGDASDPVRVTDVPDPTDPNDPPANKNSTALIFKPSGGLVYGQHQVIIRVFRAAYLAGDDGPTVFRWQGRGPGKEDENKGWKIVINGFTGRSRFYLGGEDIED